MRLAFVTVGDPARLTGGYLYHREVFARLRARGLALDEIVAAGAELAEQLAAAPALGARHRPEAYTATVVDALARAVCAPWLDRWRARGPLVAMVHELPSVAGAGDAAELDCEAPLLRADRLIAVSEDGARRLAARGAPPERIVVASGGYDRLGAAPARRPAGLPPTVLAVGQWIPRKGLLELARAWALIAPSRPGWRLELVGETSADGPYAEAVHRALAAAPVGSVAVRGPLSDNELARAYAGAAIFALPSRYEGYGIAFAEALAFGLPVVGCAVGPVPALVGPEAGFLVPPGDERALAGTLALLIDDAALRERMAGAARARAIALPTWDDCAARFLAAVEQAVAERRGSIPPSLRP